MRSVDSSNVAAFLASVRDPQRRNDAERLCAMMQELSGEPAQMWGGSIIGFGSRRYHNKSGLEVATMRIGFSPRAKELVLYVTGQSARFDESTARLGSYRRGKGILSIPRLAQLDEQILRELIAEALAQTKVPSGQPGWPALTVHDPSKAGKAVRQQFSHSFMSDTKWRKALAAVATAAPGTDHMLVKFIDVAEPRRMAFPPSLDCPRPYMDTNEFGPVELRAIEWLELRVDLHPILGPIGQFQLERVAGGTRIIGHRR